MSRPYNYFARLDEKEREFLTRYILGESPFDLAREIWTAEEMPTGPIIKSVTLLNTKRFSEALDYVTEPIMNPQALAMRQLKIADSAEDDRVKIEAVRSASQIIGLVKPLRTKEAKDNRRLKNPKVKQPPMPKTELYEKLEQLAKKISGTDHPS